MTQKIGLGYVQPRRIYNQNIKTVNQNTNNSYSGINIRAYAYACRTIKGNSFFCLTKPMYARETWMSLAASGNAGPGSWSRIGFNY